MEYTKLEIDPAVFDLKNIWYVKWVDSRQIGSGWVPVELVATASLTCHSVGFLIHDLEDSIMLAPHNAEQPLQINGGLEIPKKAILVQQRLEMAE